MTRVLLDTNTLLLFLVGNVCPERVGRHRRLREFDLDDLGWVNDQAHSFSRHVTLPNIVTEVSNFVGSLKQEIAPGAVFALATYCKEVAEVYEESRDVVLEPYYQKLGVADAAVVRMASAEVTVMTTDHQLDAYLRDRGVQVLNLWHRKTRR